MTLHEKLRSATADAHRRAESRELQRRLVRGAVDAGTLGAYLGQLRHVHVELERLLDAHPATAAAIGWSDALRHSRNLDADLDALGAARLDPTPATARLLAAIGEAVRADAASLVGFLYVLEGSMNGNRFIVRALRRSPAGERCTFAYFDPYGDEQPERWSAFRRALAGISSGGPREHGIIDAALRTFEGIAAISDEVTSEAVPVTAVPVP